MAVTNGGSRSIVQPYLFCNQGFTSDAVERPQKEQGNGKRQKRVTRQGGGLQEFLQKAPKGVGSAFHLSADRAGFAGVVVTGVQKNEDVIR